ncbi:MAG: TIGR02757 family protein [Synergistaceae bacterium]|nr:TIGR02757 family protein [Synergistaceae bacterium]
MDKVKLKAFLEGMYYVYARRELVNPDPLYFLYSYSDVRDREITGLIASSLAYGRVAQIMKSVDKVLSCLGDRPREFLLKNKDFEVVPSSFKHRFTTAYDMNNLLANVTGVLKEYGSIEAFAGECLKSSGGDLFSGMDKFSDRLSQNKKDGSFSLVSAPRDGSACKRLFLYLKWMVRDIDVDPGGWEIMDKRDLLIPLDVHMHRISSLLHLSNRKSHDLLAASSVSHAFRSISPSDPTRFDFPLSRFGIRHIHLSFLLGDAYYITSASSTQ